MDPNKRHREYQRRKRGNTRHYLLRPVLLEALREPVTVFELADKLYPDDPGAQCRNTLQSRLLRMEDEGLVECIGRSREGGKWLRNLYVVKGGDALDCSK